jgi:hypothetical protein
MRDRALPFIYKIDKEHRIVLSTGSGTLTLDDFLTHQKRLLEDPDFDPSHAQLADFSQVTQLVPVQGGVEKVAQKDVFLPSSRRAIVVKNDLQYGFARMFQIHRDFSGERGIRVFRNIDEALDWIFSKNDTATDERQ